ncbi:hypothetical protein FXO37_26810 [Capsicum annuum]|nr:hypothetical protein FXO37_26810 [Capsicum annuum]
MGEEGGVVMKKMENEGWGRGGYEEDEKWVVTVSSNLEISAKSRSGSKEDANGGSSISKDENTAQQLRNDVKVKRKLDLQQPQEGQQWKSLFTGAKLNARGIDLSYVALVVKDGAKLVQLVPSDVETKNAKWRKVVILYVIGNSPSIGTLERFITSQWNFVAKRALNRISSALGNPPFADDRIFEKYDSSIILKVISVQDPSGRIFEQKLEYEWVPAYYSTCLMIGHKYKPKEKKTPPEPRKRKLILPWLQKHTTEVPDQLKLDIVSIRISPHCSRK